MPEKERTGEKIALLGIGALIGGAIAALLAWGTTAEPAESVAPQRTTVPRTVPAHRPVVAHDEAEQCQVCMHLKRDCLFQPCGHTVTCFACSKQVSLCPLCRANVDEVIYPVFI